MSLLNILCKPGRGSHVSCTFLLLVAGVAVRGADLADVFAQSDQQSGVELLRRVFVAQIPPVRHLFMAKKWAVNMTT